MLFQTLRILRDTSCRDSLAYLHIIVPLGKSNYCGLTEYKLRKPDETDTMPKLDAPRSGGWSRILDRRDSRYGVLLSEFLLRFPFCGIRMKPIASQILGPPC